MIPVTVRLHGPLAKKRPQGDLCFELPSAPADKKELIAILTKALGFNAKAGIMLKVNGKSVHVYKDGFAGIDPIIIDMYPLMMGG